MRIEYLHGRERNRGSRATIERRGKSRTYHNISNASGQRLGRIVQALLKTGQFSDARGERWYAIFPRIRHE